MQLILVVLGGVVARPGVLTFGHRQVLEHLWGAGQTITQIAGLLGVPVCTVSREVARNNSARHGTKNPLGRLLPPGRGSPAVSVGVSGAVGAAALGRGPVSA
ncbi:hypothetical protein Nm8I071_14920 [Nonomuraea sp. TT08I-71]|nr:hypothetical protein Nm8I071_14920 [Nonomuraea sp. TT08I-71]